MDTCRTILESGKVETQEERKYFMDCMLQASKGIDTKNLVIGVSSVIIGGITLAVWLAKKLIKK